MTDPTKSLRLKTMPGVCDPRYAEPRPCIRGDMRHDRTYRGGNVYVITHSYAPAVIPDTSQGWNPASCWTTVRSFRLTGPRTSAISIWLKAASTLH
ncbi:hypothetical protein ABIC08_007717 [Bradyrhizobium sp. RT9b]